VWNRDNVDMYGFHLQIPPGATSLTIDLDLILAPEALGPDSSTAATPELMILNWGSLLPLSKQQNYGSAQLCKPTLAYPKGWRFGTALPVERGGRRRHRVQTQLADHAGGLAVDRGQIFPNHRP